MFCPLFSLFTTEDLEDNANDESGPNTTPDIDLLQDGPSMFFGKDVDGANSISSTTSLDLEPVFRFLYLYAMKLYGVNAINKWLKTNTNKSFIDMVTTSDIAYVVSLLRNSKEVWEQDLDISQMNPSEQKKYKDGCEGYVVKKPIFSGGVNTKRTYCGVMWNAQGRTFYDDVRMKWDLAFDDEETWDKLCSGWDEWIELSRGQKHWKRKTRNPLRSWQEDDNDAIEGLRGLSAGRQERVFLPGDHGFQPRRLSSDRKRKRIGAGEENVNSPGLSIATVTNGEMENACNGEDRRQAVRIDGKRRKEQYSSEESSSSEEETLQEAYQALKKSRGKKRSATSYRGPESEESSEDDSSEKYDEEGEDPPRKSDKRKGRSVATKVAPAVATRNARRIGQGTKGKRKSS